MKQTLYDFYNASSTGFYILALDLGFFAVCLILASLILLVVFSPEIWAWMVLRPAISGTALLIANLGGCIWMALKRAWG